MDVLVLDRVSVISYQGRPVLMYKFVGDKRWRQIYLTRNDFPPVEGAPLGFNL